MSFGKILSSSASGEHSKSMPSTSTATNTSKDVEALKDSTEAAVTVLSGTERPHPKAPQLLARTPAQQPSQKRLRPISCRKLHPPRPAPHQVPRSPALVVLLVF